MSKNKAIRVLHLLKNFEIGGVETSNIKLANYLVKKVDFWGIVAVDGKYKGQGIISSSINTYSKLNKLNNPFYFASNLLYILRIIRRNNVNIIHYHFRIYLPYILLIKLFFPQIKIIYTHHIAFKDRLVNFIYADFFVAISEPNKINLNNNIFLKNNYTIIKNGVIIKYGENTEKRSLYNLGFVGRFDKIKGLNFLITSFYNNLDSLSDYKLIIRGEGSLDEPIKELIKQTDKIEIYGPQTTVEKIYNSIGILIVPSTPNTNAVETFPNIVIMEAMSIFIPVICPDNIILDGNFKDRENIIIYKGNDEEDLISKIMLISKDPVLTKTITENAFTTIVNHFSFEKFGDNILLLYEKIIN